MDKEEEFTKEEMFYKLLEEVCFGSNKLSKKQGEILYSYINAENANLTVCPECRVDDFIHMAGCKLAKIPLKQLLE